MYDFIVQLLHPVTLLFLILVIVLVRLWRSQTVPRQNLWLLASALMLLALFCTPATAFLAANIFERPFPPALQRPDVAEAIVVLGGGVLWPASDELKTRPTDSTLRRCFAAAELYRRGDPCPILVAGGVGNPSRHGPPEAHVMRDCLLTMGIPAADIVLETESRNTAESASASKRVLDELSIHSVVLVTDATHLLRATRCFRKQGLDVVPAGAYYRAKHFHASLFQFVPRAGAAKDNQAVFHEALGLVWYWLRGRI